MDNHTYARAYEHLRSKACDPDRIPWPDLYTAYHECGNPQHFCYALGLLSADSRDLRLLAVRLVRETPIGEGRMVADLLADPRSLTALEVAERHARGEATDRKLTRARSAAQAVAWAAKAAQAAELPASWDTAFWAAWAAQSVARTASWDTAWATASWAAEAAAKAAAAQETAHVAQLFIIRDAFPWEKVAALAEKWEQQQQSAQEAR